MTHYQAIVIGVGSMGAATCYQLARRGVRVLGLEQYDISHGLGSHSGQSRLIRQAYFEHPDYVPLLKEAYAGWDSIQQASGEQLYFPTGLAYFTTPQHPISLGVRHSAKQFGLTIEEFKENPWAQFAIPRGWDILLEKEAGFLLPEKSIKVFAHRASQSGAEIHTRETVQRLQLSGQQVVVETDKSTYSADKVIVTAGAYTSRLVRLPVPLTVTRQLIGWTEKVTDSTFTLDQLPCWMVATEDIEGLYYGFPALNGAVEGPVGMKLAHHVAGEEMMEVAQMNFDSSIERRKLQSVLDRYLPSANTKMEEMQMCRYTYSPDEHFILDALSAYRYRVMVATGFSGHGFKFAPAIGQALADWALDGFTDLPVDFLGLGRFGASR